MKYLVVVVFLLFGVVGTARAESMVDIVFPVDGDVSFSDTFDAPRSGGRVHQATDVMADKMTPVLAATDGVILFAPMEEPSYGYMIMLGGDDGYQYNYVHLNNDTPGTDDGLGGPENAYVSGVVKGARVTRGQHIAWVGDSGNAEATAPHLHFEILDPENVILNPYASLVAAYEAFTAASYSFNPEAEGDQITIDDNQGIVETEESAPCTAGALMRTPEVSTVYYCGRDGGRYVFQDEGTYFSWFENFDDVITISGDEMSVIPLKGVITYKPGSFMLKLPSVPKVYAVGQGGVLHWIPSQEVAEALYGSKWASFIRDLPESFYPAYSLGSHVVVQ